MSKPRNVAVWAGFVFLLFFAVSFAQQPPNPQPAKPKTNGSPGHSEAKPSAGKSATETPSKEEQGRAISNIDPSQYVGTQACADCHENAGGSFTTNPHHKTLEDKSPDRQGCEACHGAGKAHAESGDPDNIVRFESVSKAGIAKICSECHNLSQGNTSSLHSSHSKADVGCLDCHSVHSAKVQGHLLKSENPKLCSTCHANRQH